MEFEIPSFLRNRILNIVVFVAVFLLFFGLMTQFSWDGITTFYIAAVTFGLCGLPTTFAGVSIWAGACKIFHFSEAVSYWGAAVVLVVCFTIQWSFLVACAGRRDDPDA